MSQPPTLTDIFQSNLIKAETKDEEKEEKEKQEESKKGIKRKFDLSDLSRDDDNGDESLKPMDQKNREKNLKKAKNVGISLLPLLLC